MSAEDIARTGFMLAALYDRVNELVKDEPVETCDLFEVEEVTVKIRRERSIKCVY